jgi:hypothetical protein
VEGELSPYQCDRIARALEFEGNVRLFGDDLRTLRSLASALEKMNGNERKGIARILGFVKKTPASQKKYATVSDVEVCDPEDRFLRIGASLDSLATSRDSNAPFLFCVVDAASVENLIYGLRHVARDQLVATSAKAEIMRSNYFGAALPVAKSYGSPSDHEAFDIEMRKKTVDALLLTGLNIKFDDIQIPAMSRVYWLRPAILKAFLKALHTVQSSVGLKDNGADADSDGKHLVDALLFGGLPPIATAHGMITIAISNTAEIPRVFVKSERRAINAVRAMKSKNAFLLKHNLDYTSQYQNQEAREKLFAQVHEDSFHAAWKTAWSEAWLKGRRDVLQWISSPERTAEEIEAVVSGRALLSEPEMNQEQSVGKEKVAKGKK